MGIQSPNEIYSLTEKHLRSAHRPMTCTELMEFDDVRTAATEEYGQDVQLATNKLSDVLGFMWRRDVLLRHPAPRGSSGKARYAYSGPTDKPDVAPPLPPPSSLKKKKPVFTITESDTDVTIEFDNVTLIVRRR